MQRVRLSTLRPGQSFPKSVFLPSGQKLLGAWVALTEHHLEMMRRQGETEIIFAEDVSELEAAGVVQRVDTAHLAVGKKVEAPVMTPSGQWVLDTDDEVEEHHLEAIEAGGGAFKATVDPTAEVRRARLQLAEKMAEQLEQDLDHLPLRVAALGPTGWINAEDAPDWPDVDVLTQQRSTTVDALRKLYARVEAGAPVSVTDFHPLVDGLLDKLAAHPSRFTQLALLLQRREDYLPDHAFTTTVLAVSIAANLKWSRDDSRTMGLAALVYDLGMLLVPQRIRTGASELTELDRARVRKHTALTLSMLEHVEGIPPIVKLAAFQHHERENGSGYPRARRKDQICDYARVLAVADSFAAATAPRTFRKKKLPYAAMEEMLRSAAATVFWTPACRALVHTAGLFPVGSFVKLSTGSRAHVIGSNATAVDRPVIRLLDDDKHAGDVVDLSKLPKSELAVVRPIDIDALAA